MSPEEKTTSESYQVHRAQSPKTVACACVTVSDTRTPEADTSGQLIQELLTAAGHTSVSYRLVKDDPVAIRMELDRLQGIANCPVILLTGGTGIAPRDQTVDVVAALLDKKLDGFGELFRMLSFQEIGAGAMLSRALAGVRGSQIIFCMPGSPHAVRLAMSRLILPELGHLAFQMGIS